MEAPPPIASITVQDLALPLVGGVGRKLYLSSENCDGDFHDDGRIIGVLQLTDRKDELLLGLGVDVLPIQL